MKRLRKRALNLTKAGVITGVGTSVVAGMGGSTAGLAALSSTYPTMGTVIGATTTLSMIPKTKSRRRHRR